jgi:tetratricopeptide (TPR) repeat protein
MKNVIRSIPLIAAVTLAALVSTSCTRHARATRRLDHANRYFDSGQYDKAEIEYLNVLQLDRQNPDAIGRLGVILQAEGRVGRSIIYLTKARELRPEDLEVRLKLGLAYLEIGDLKRARDEANFILDRQPQDEQAPLLLTEASAGPKDIEESRKRLQRLPPPAAEGAPVLVALGMLDLRLLQVKEAEAAFKRAQALAPGSSGPYTALGNLYWTQKDLPQAEAAFRQAAELSPARSPKKLQYAQFKIQTGDLAAGKRLLEEVTRNTPDYLPAWVWLAEIAATEKKYDESQTLVDKALARDMLQPEALLLSARLMMVKGDSARAVAALEKMVSVYPNSPQASFQLSRAYAAHGDAGKAADTLSQTIALAPGFAEAILALAEINIRRGDLSAAILSLTRLAQQRPDLAQARLFLALAYTKHGDLEDALKVYRQLEEQYPRNPQAPMLRGQVLLQQDKRDEARKAFDRTRELAPDYVPALEQLVNLDLIEKQYPTAQQRVETEMARRPAAAGTLQLLLAKIYAAQHENPQAMIALQKAIELQPDSPTAYLFLAQLYAGANQKDKALADLNQLVARNPKDVGALTLLGMVQDQQKDYAAARDTYEKILVINPKFGVVLNNLAYLYAERFDQLDKARELAQRARELMPQDPSVADTLGWILSRQHEYPRALTLLQENAEKYPTEPVVQFHLGMTRYMMGEAGPARLALQGALHINKDFPGSDEARRCLAILDVDVKAAGPEVRTSLEKAVAQRPDDPIALDRLAAVYALSGAPDKAIDTYETALRAHPENAAAMLGLARLYAGRGDTAKALDTAKNARKLLPDDPAVAYELGRLAFQTGDYPWAASLLQEAARKQPDQLNVQFDYAKAAYSVGRIADAETAMNQAVQTNAAFPRIDDAKSFLEMLALSANPSEAAAAISKIEQILKSDPTNLPALVVAAVVAEHKPDVAAAKQAYEKILARYPDFSPAQKRLAILYASNPGDSQKAFDAATKARQAFPDDAELTKAFGIIVYRQGDYARAASLLQESAGKRAGDGELTYYLGMAQLQLNKRAEGKQTLQRALELGLKDELAADARKNLAKLK